MKMSESIKSIAPAFAKVQGALKDLFKGTKGYGYNYATLDQVLKEIRMQNEKEGISFMQNLGVEGEEIKIETLLMHSSGEYFLFNSSFPFAKMKQMNDYQAAGSGFTYARRYTLSSIFGVASDEDKDAHGEQEDEKEKEKIEQTELSDNNFRKQVTFMASTKDKQKVVVELLGLLNMSKLEEVKEKRAFIEQLELKLNKL